MKRKFLSVFVGILLVVSMLSMVSAISPSRPNLVGDLNKIDLDFRVPVFPSLSITGSEVVTIGQFSTHDFEISVPDLPDKDISDLKYSWFFGVWAIMDDSGNIIAQIPNEVDLGNSNIYSGEIKHAFEEGGVYYYTPAMIEVKQEFQDGIWVTVSEEVIEKDFFKINVAGTPGQPSLIDNIGAFFSKVFDWIISWFD